MRAKKKLGDMLNDAGLLPEDDLQQAIEKSRKVSLRLGEYLVVKGLVKEENIIALLSDGHLLVEGAPGLAKTTAIKELADAGSTPATESTTTNNFGAGGAGTKFW